MLSLITGAGCKAAVVAIGAPPRPSRRGRVESTRRVVRSSGAAVAPGELVRAEVPQEDWRTILRATNALLGAQGLGDEGGVPGHDPRNRRVVRPEVIAAGRRGRRLGVAVEQPAPARVTESVEKVDAVVEAMTNGDLKGVCVLDA